LRGLTRREGELGLNGLPESLRGGVLIARHPGASFSIVRGRLLLFFT
jgi:hypothetical protein